MAYTINGMVNTLEDIAALFSNTEPEVEEPKETVEETPQQETEEKEETITEATPELLFGLPEKVGNELNTESEEREPTDKNRPSPNNNIYSSIANYFAEKGALSNLSDEEIKDIKDVQSLVDAFEKNNDLRLDETQRRIKEALDYGVEIPVIQQYEQSIQQLNSITEEQLEAETTQGENLRKGIIYQYQKTLGLSDEKAMKMVDRAISGGTDIEDAKEYLDSLKESYSNEYKNLIAEQKRIVNEAKKLQEEQLKSLKKTLMEDETILGDIQVDAKTRQLAWDYWMKPVYKTEKGYRTELQKYVDDHPDEFQMNIALFFALTDKFKKKGKVLEGTVKKEKKKAIKELEQVINNTQRTPDGILNFINNDPNASFNGMTFAPPELWNK